MYKENYGYYLACVAAFPVPPPPPPGVSLQFQSKERGTRVKDRAGHAKTYFHETSKGQ